ncbi:PREDICTED: mitochondrial uncoupling protein 3 [Theobroma cacao]|uniref:Mitochondrial uncoupling protein 3 n=1 Tax=Theobroma cacao TaxID=3641 RepID=A0AB32VLS1_THECC|nr:PREDICTED: mitochondrial uncoupling protein 3 [Theobroma cacao]
MDASQTGIQTQTQTQTRFRIKILLTSLSAMVAETSTFPIDLTKTRIQLHGESQPLSSSTPSTNAFRVASEIVREQGVLGLYKGLSPAIIRHLFYTPIRIVGYENLRNFVSSDGSLSLSSKALVGGISGVIAQVVASPADLVKVRMQADGRIVSRGLQPRYKGPFDALKKIVAMEGFGGLWKGVFPNVQRAFLVNMGELACYDHAKRFVISNQISDDNIYAHTLASIMSGLSATALSCPADVVKTRMMNQAGGKGGNVMYKNSYDCLVKTVKIEGLTALWKGFFPTWARLGPWQFVFWVSYEKFRQIAGLSSF